MNKYVYYCFGMINALIIKIWMLRVEIYEPFIWMVQGVLIISEPCRFDGVEGLDLFYHDDINER
jgi:hypothetical protein